MSPPILHAAESLGAPPFLGRSHGEPQGEPRVLVRWRKTILWLPQGIGDLRHSQTMATDDLGLGLARLSDALLPGAVVPRESAFPSVRGSPITLTLGVRDVMLGIGTGEEVPRLMSVFIR